MTHLEDLVRDTLMARAADAPDGARLLDSVHRGVIRRRRVALAAATLAAASIVAVIAVSTALIVGTGDGSKTPATQPPAAPTTRSTTPSSTTTVHTRTTTAPAPNSTPTTQAGVALQSVRWTSVRYPMAPHCGHVFNPPVSIGQIAYPIPAPGVQLAVVLVRCTSGAGTPPVAVYVYDRATSTTLPHLAGTLVADTDEWQASTFSVSGATVSLPVAGFSSTALPNCCPDVHTTLIWRWTGSKYRLATPIPPHANAVAFGLSY